MSFARRILALRHIALDLLPVISPAWGRILLSRRQTVEFIRPFEVRSTAPASVFLPALKRTPEGPLVPDRQNGAVIRFERDAVWLLRTGQVLDDLRIIPTGNVVLNRKYHVDLDFKPVRGLFKSHRLAGSEEALIACWPHGWGSYYEFVVYIVAKLLRIEDALGPEIWKQAKLAYPRRVQPYERDFLQALGIDEDRVIDTRTFGGAVGASRIVVANNHTRRHPSPDDIHRLRRRFVPRDGNASRRLYISRAGTRRVVNESELRPILDRHGVEFIPDVPRSLREQVDLFRQASLIIGPHGAAFTNIIWSPPGTRLIELFGQTYYPPHFQYLAEILEHRYACWMDAGGSRQSNATRHDDLYVDPVVFARLLESALVGAGS